MRATKSAVILLVTIALAAGCATTGPHGERSLILIDTATEVQMGQESDMGIRQEYPVLTDPAVASYIAEIGARVAANSERRDVEYTFTVLQSDLVNAFAAPGGYIYVTTGLLRMADDEAEVACVLAHEIGHVIGRHSVRAMQNALGMQLVAELILGSDGDAWGQVAGVGAGLFMMKNSRDHEFQADQFGVKYAVLACYDHVGMIRFFGKLIEMHGAGGGGFAGWLSTHPDTNERIARAHTEIGNYELVGHPVARNAQTYQTRTASLPVVGD